MLPYKTKPAPPGASRKHREVQEHALNFYHAHKSDEAFRSKERMALYLHDVELPRHFEAALIPSWARIRVWLPREGRLKDMREEQARAASPAHKRPPARKRAGAHK